MRIIDLIKVPTDMDSEGNFVANDLTMSYRTQTEAVATAGTSTMRDMISNANPDLPGVKDGKITCTERTTTSKKGIVHHNVRFLIKEPQVGVKQGPLGLVAENTDIEQTISISYSGPKRIDANPLFVSHSGKLIDEILSSLADAMGNKNGLAEILKGA